jgi:hypothetical protein
MSRADATDPNAIDEINPDDLVHSGRDRDDLRHQGDRGWWPQVTPDHGAQPRYKKPPREKWRIDPFAEQPIPLTEHERLITDAARRLARIARAEAPRLANGGFHEDAIGREINDVLTPRVALVVSLLQEDERGLALGEFKRVIWAEIDMIRARKH